MSANKSNTNISGYKSQKVTIVHYIQGVLHWHMFMPGCHPSAGRRLSPHETLAHPYGLVCIHLRRRIVGVVVVEARDCSRWYDRFHVRNLSAPRTICSNGENAFPVLSVWGFSWGPKKFHAGVQPRPCQ